MDQNKIVQLSRFIQNGKLYFHPERERIEANLPTACPSNHAPSLLELDNGDLLCVWFAGIEEGGGDIHVYMSRLEACGGEWSEPIRLTVDDTTADQNPSLFQAPDGTVWLIHTSMDPRGCSLE